MQNNPKYTPVRFSHLTSYAGVGAIIRNINDMLMVVVDTRYWTDKNDGISAECIPYVTRITKALDLGKDLRMPPKAKEIENSRIEGSYLPAVLFPTYAVCKKCGLLHNNPWRKDDIYTTKTFQCEQCGFRLEQVTWCAVSSNGHLDDVPWHYICHMKNNNTCKPDYSQNYLFLKTNKNGNKIIECKKCGSHGRYDNFYGNNNIKIINKQQPWMYKQPDQDQLNVEILEINNPGVYLPERVNALVIPPESRMNTGTVVDRLFNNSKRCREIEKIKLPVRKKGALKKIATEYRCTVTEVKTALKQIRDGYPQLDNMTICDLLEDEYKAFLTPIDNVKDDEDFVTEHKTQHWHELKDRYTENNLLTTIEIINHLIVAKRLREIQVFKGFSRIPDEDRVIVPPDIVGSSNWLPAIELFGEGLFFTIDEHILSEWESVESIRTRAAEIAIRYEKAEITTFQDVIVTPRFLLLHTLSHLIIRELETKAGYPAASLKERIYCSKNAKMSGILIYTTVADIVGSLGGIIESGEPDAFISLLDSVFKHAQWCSLDPVCSEHEGQGPGWLNRAACHACALIPETSCDYSNIFLDRVFIKGSEELQIPPFLEFAANLKGNR